jgi:uncharacterized membrane protein YhfC
LDSEIVFSGAVVGGYFAISGACVLAPVFYLIYYTFKNKINLLAVLAGVVGSFVFGYFILGFALGSFAPQATAASDEIKYALTSAICTGAVESVGFFVAMFALRKKWDETDTPISYALGYSLFTMLFVRGANAFIRLGEVYTTNSKGLEAVLSSVSGEAVEVLRRELTELSLIEPVKLYISAIDCIVLFAAMAALCRIMWYSVCSDGRKRVDLALVGIVLRAAMEFPTCLNNPSIAAYAVMHYVPAALCIAFAAFLSYKLDEKENISAGALNKKLL